MLKVGRDSLDQQQQNFQRSQVSQQAQLPTLRQEQLHNQNQIYKNFYKQQLDDLVQQKAQQRRQIKQKEQRQRQIYNQRINHTNQAQKMKDISYRNYYNLLLNNQSNMSKNYIPYDQMNINKDKLIHKNIEQQKIRAQMLHEQEQRRIQQAKKNYREFLADQINEKYHHNVVTSSVKERQNQQYKKATYNPQQLAKFERERRLIEMQRYKQDLDKTNNSGKRQRSLTYTNPTKNDFNVHQVEDRHNPMVNPLPYNIQNPYILRQMKRKSAFEEQGNNSSRYY